MSAHRFSHLLNSADAVSTPWTWPALSPFATLPTTGLAASPIMGQIYQAALETARRQLAKRSLLFTWNARQN